MRTLGISALLLLLSLGTPAQVVPGKPVAASAKSQPAAAWRHPAFPHGLETAVRLAPLPARASATLGLPDAEKRLPVGLRRDILEAASIAGPASLQWVRAPRGGFTARFALASPEAAALRVGLEIRGLPPDAELRARGASGEPSPPAAGRAIAEAMAREGVYWTPLTEGASQAIELWLPDGADPSAIAFAARGASHFAAGPATGFKSTGPGASQPCEQDVACVAGGNAAVATIARAVAKVVYTENGMSYLCSGTLVNDGDPASQVPYFFTAAHCIDSQAAASTVNTFWFFEAALCGAKGAAAFRQLSGGATLLHANVASDAALLRLADAAPEGAWFAGWDAAPLAAGVGLLALHHPMGDLKKASLGQSLAPTEGAGASYATAAWSVGSTEGGSSGSGLFTRAGAEYVLRGALRGGSASCQSSGNVADPANRDFYSRLDREAPALAKWLSAPAGPAEDFTGMWWNPDESGWGVSIIQSPANALFVAWFTFDDDGPTWLVAPGGRWTSASTFEGPLYRASGTVFDRPYDAGNAGMAVRGRVRLDFARGGTATFRATVDGRDVVKPLLRLAM